MSDSEKAAFIEALQANDARKAQRFLCWMRSHHLLEEKWAKREDPTFDDIWSHEFAALMWEGVVANFACDLGLGVARCQPGKNAPNLDFQFTHGLESVYAECVVPQASDKSQESVRADVEKTDDAQWNWGVTGISNTHAEFGLRVTNSMGVKNRHIELVFPTGNPAPVVVFLNTAFVSKQGHVSSNDLRGISPVASALFGTDGVPTFEIDINAQRPVNRSVKSVPNIDKTKESTTVQVPREGFLTQSLSRISAVVHMPAKQPFALVAEHGDQDYSFIREFKSHTELILNPNADTPLSQQLLEVFYPRRLVTFDRTSKALRVSDQSCSSANG